MKRSIVAFVAGTIAWVLVASVLNRMLRLTVPGYVAAEPAMAFTLAMKIGRLTMGALASVAAGATIGAIALRGQRVAWIFGAFVLALFLPAHIWLWAKFPAWYHLAFLLTIVPLVVLGSKLTARSALGSEGIGARAG